MRSDGVVVLHVTHEDVAQVSRLPTGSDLRQEQDVHHLIRGTDWI
jgi:hypothetical protein